MPHRPIRAVFLDLDDTLCDTISCRPQRVRVALAHVCARLGRTDLDLDALVFRTVDPLECGSAPDHVAALARTEARFRALIEELAPDDPVMLAAAGMRAVWYNHRGDPLIEGFPPPDITITRFAELPAALAAVAHP